MTENERIVAWNKERNLIKTPAELNPCRELSFIQEELIEIITNTSSEEARLLATAIVSAIAIGESVKLVNLLRDFSSNYAEPNPRIEDEVLLDGLADIKVFATGTMAKAGYDPDKVMDETLKEIESRTGTMIDGKFVKDKSPEVTRNWYTANYRNARI